MINADKNNRPLDLSYLRDMSGDSAEFMIEMIEMFEKQTPIYLLELEQAIAAENWKATYEHAHKIKPTFFYVGREDVRDHMQEMENNARELKNIETLPAALQEVKSFVGILYQQLEDAKAKLLQGS